MQWFYPCICPRDCYLFGRLGHLRVIYPCSILGTSFCKTWEVYYHVTIWFYCCYIKYTSTRAPWILYEGTLLISCFICYFVCFILSYSCRKFFLPILFYKTQEIVSSSSNAFRMSMDTTNYPPLIDLLLNIIHLYISLICINANVAFSRLLSSEWQNDHQRVIYKLPQ
jgi:hypothetical protein